MKELIPQRVIRNWRYRAEESILNAYTTRNKSRWAF
jgi:hypothetical protein